MATAAPDPKTFETWEDAFQYPVPTVRAMDKKLRAGVTESQERVRGVVGSSYRELLSTAHTIIDIHSQTLRVEDLLAQAAKKSDSRVVEKIAGNADKLHTYRRGRDETRFTHAAQVSAVKGALAAVADRLRADADAEDGELVLGAVKLLVVARLLLKSISSRRDADAALVERLTTRLTASRAKLLRQLDRRLTRLNVDSKVLVADLSAYALATSSSPTDTLKHFLALRTLAIEARASASPSEKPQKRLRIFTATIRESQSVFPALLAASLRSLSAAPLLQDPTIRSTESLNLDVNEPWFASTVSEYTPRTRHDELSASTLQSIRKSWFTSTLPALSKAISSDLEQTADLQQVVATRRATLQLYLSSRHTLRGLPASEVLTALRRPFNDEIKALLLQRLQDLKSAVQGPVAALLTQSIAPPASLWSPDLTAHDATSQTFKSALVAARKGHSPAVAEIISAFDTAAETIVSAPALLRSMAEIKWDDDDDDDYEDEEEEDSPSIQTLLSSTDPAALRTSLATATKSTLEEVESFFKTQTATLPCTGPDAPLISILRILRALRTRAPGLTAALQDAKNNQSTPRAPLQSDFCAATVRALHQSLVAHALAQTKDVLSTRLAKFYTLPAAREMEQVWDGGAPSVPSPGVFRFLREVVKQMELLGPDIWGGDAARLLRTSVAEESVSAVESVVQILLPPSQAAAADGTSADDTSADADDAAQKETAQDETGEDADADADAPPGEADPKSEADDAQEPLSTTTLPLQLLFDTLYLSYTLSAPLAAAQSSVRALLTDASKEQLERLERNAKSYATRTSLLWGLLTS